MKMLSIICYVVDCVSVNIKWSMKCLGVWTVSAGDIVLMTAGVCQTSVVFLGFIYF